MKHSAMSKSSGLFFQVNPFREEKENEIKIIRNEDLSYIGVFLLFYRSSDWQQLTWSLQYSA
eukprot:m.154875 g.154875  ORF g.154875 m.154875 type:complete len:62 (+) comp16262_c1_seq1:49-234(+)